MIDKNKKFYITTSIAYTNAPPHIGFALELVQADALARYHKSLGEDVFFLTGTDEHGIKISKTAEGAGKEPQKFVDELAGKFINLTKILNISNNDFIRTTDRRKHWPIVLKIWRRLEKKGDIYKENYEGYYCVGCEAYITKKTKDLILTKCSVHPNLTPILIKEENYFFKLSKYAERIKKLIEKNRIKIIPETKKNEILEILKQEWTDFGDNFKKKKGLKDVSFSRSKENLKWGIPVPGDNSQIIYVWGDALVNYLSALGYPDGKKFYKYWPVDIHCIGKDILKFHALIWPAMLLSLGMKLPKAILVHGFINVNGQKMSKSLGNVVDPFELVNKYGTDAVRYYLLREISPIEDGDFTYEKFEARYNSDLAGGIGNLVARLLGIVENIEIKKSRPTKKTSEKIKRIKKNYASAMKKFRFNEALVITQELISYCDKYINEEKLWETRKIEVINDLFFALNEIGGLLQPFLPETAEKIKKAIKEQKSETLFPRIIKTNHS